MQVRAMPKAHSRQHFCALPEFSYGEILKTAAARTRQIYFGAFRRTLHHDHKASRRIVRHGYGENSRRGDVMCAVRRGTLAHEMCFTVTKSSDNGDGTCTVRLDGGELPDGDEYYLANISACPDLLFADCKVSNNFARGVLIKTKRAEVCGCTFENTHSAAVRVSAEESWGEGISAEDVRIHDNVFINCARQVGPASAVAAFTDSKTCEGEQIGSVRVYNNTVIGSGDVPDFYLKNVREPRIDDNVSAYAAKK